MLDVERERDDDIGLWNKDTDLLKIEREWLPGVLGLATAVCGSGCSRQFSMFATLQGFR